MSGPSQERNLLIYEGADLLDFTGPMQVMSHATHNHKADHPVPVFEVKTIAQKRLVHTAITLHFEPDMLLPDALDKISEYDILIVPGASLSAILQMIEGPDTPELNLIHRYTTPKIHPFSHPLLYMHRFIISGRGRHPIRTNGHNASSRPRSTGRNLLRPRPIRNPNTNCASTFRRWRSY